MSQSLKIAQVISGINNIFLLEECRGPLPAHLDESSVIHACRFEPSGETPLAQQASKQLIQARLKSKRMNTHAIHSPEKNNPEKNSLEKNEQNPLICGDYVSYRPLEENTGLIFHRLKRKNTLTRWNSKNKSIQSMAVNVDLVVLVLSYQYPFCPEDFIESVKLSCLNEQIPFMVCLNKKDQVLLDKTQKLLEGPLKNVPIVHTSFLDPKHTQESIEQLKAYFKGQSVVLVGFSGVGKSSIVNALIDQQSIDRVQKIQALSVKNKQGLHTTVYSRIFQGDGFQIRDTPGVKHWELYHWSLNQLKERFWEFFPHSCFYDNCFHIKTLDCSIEQAHKDGKIQAYLYPCYQRLVYQNYSYHFLKNKQYQQGAYKNKKWFEILPKLAWHESTYTPLSELSKRKAKEHKSSVSSKKAKRKLSPDDQGRGLSKRKKSQFYQNEQEHDERED